MDQLPHELITLIAGFLEDPDLLTFKNVSKEFYQIFLNIGLQEVIIVYKEHADQLIKLIEKGLKLYRTKIICMYADDNFLKALSSVHTIDLESCEQITDEGIKALAGVHTINLCGCHQITNEGIKELSSVHTIEINNCKQITQAGVESLNNCKVFHKYYLTMNSPYISDYIFLSPLEERRRWA